VHAITDSAAAQQLSLRNQTTTTMSAGISSTLKKRACPPLHVLARPVSFENIVELVRFDQILREHFWSAVLSIEAALRSVTGARNIDEIWAILS